MKQRFFIKLHHSSYNVKKPQEHFFNPNLVGGVFLPPWWSSFNNSEMVKAINVTFSSIK